MRNLRAILIPMAFLGAVTVGVSAQSNPTMDIIIATNNTTFGEAAYLVLTATKTIPDGANFVEAASAIEKAGWKIKSEPAGEEITLGSYCYLIMRAFDMQGGIMYSIFPGPRYAERELDYLGFIHADATPYRTLSGVEAVSILGEVMRSRGESK